MVYKFLFSTIACFFIKLLGFLGLLARYRYTQVTPFVSNDLLFYLVAMVKLSNINQCHYILLQTFFYFLFFQQIRTMASISKKVVAVGDAGCGKNSLLIAFSKDKALDESSPQILEYGVIDARVDGTKVALNFCSTSG